MTTVRPWERKSGHHSRNRARVDAEKRETENLRREEKQIPVKPRDDGFLPDHLGIVNDPDDPKPII